MPQNAKLLVFAKQMRHEATPFEVVLWRHLSKSQLGGFKFRRQRVIEDNIVDFFCAQKGLIVEVDGDTHDSERDTGRDLTLSEEGYKVLRFSNADVGSNLDSVLSEILDTLKEMPARWAAPHPNPSPEPKASEAQREGLR